jgi:hypothetical protein
MQLKFLGSVLLLVLVILCYALTANAQDMDSKISNDKYIKLNESTAIKQGILNQTELDDLKMRAMNISLLAEKLNESVLNASIKSIDFYIPVNDIPTRSEASESNLTWVQVPVGPVLVPVPIPDENDIHVIHACYEYWVEHKDEITGVITKTLETICDGGTGGGPDHFPPVSR